MPSADCVMGSNVCSDDRGGRCRCASVGVRRKHCGTVERCDGILAFGLACAHMRAYSLLIARHARGAGPSPAARAHSGQPSGQPPQSARAAVSLSWDAADAGSAGCCEHHVCGVNMYDLRLRPASAAESREAPPGADTERARWFSNTRQDTAHVTLKRVFAIRVA
jgi:hypothetical protein